MRACMARTRRSSRRNWSTRFAAAATASDWPSFAAGPFFAAASRIGATFAAASANLPALYSGSAWAYTARSRTCSAFSVSSCLSSAVSDVYPATALTAASAVFSALG